MIAASLFSDCVATNLLVLVGKARGVGWLVRHTAPHISDICVPLRRQMTRKTALKYEEQVEERKMLVHLFIMTSAVFSVMSFQQQAQFATLVRT